MADRESGKVLALDIEPRTGTYHEWPQLLPRQGFERQIISLLPNIPGSRCFNARSVRRARSTLKSGDATARKPPTCSRDIVENAPSKPSTRPHRHDGELDPKPFAGSLHRLYGGKVRGRRGIKQHPDPPRPGHSLLQYLQLLGDEIGENDCQARDVAAGSRKVRHVSDADGVGMGGKHNWDRLGRLLGSLHVGRRHREYDVNIHADQVGRQLRQLVNRFRPSELNDNILAFDMAELAQADPRRLDPASSRRQISIFALRCQRLGSKLVETFDTAWTARRSLGSTSTSCTLRLAVSSKRRVSPVVPTQNSESQEILDLFPAFRVLSRDTPTST